MKNILLLILLCLGTNSYAQYFQRYFNEVVGSPPKRTEAFDDGLKSRLNYDSIKSNYFFVGTGYSELSPAATSGTDARLRFIRTRRSGAVSVNNAYQFADSTTKWFESRGKGLCEIDGGSGGYVVVGSVNNNPATKATTIPGGTDMLFSIFNNSGTPALKERIDVAGGADVATGVVRSSFVKNTYLVCGYSVKEKTVNAVVARIAGNGAVVWLRSINMVAGVQCNTSSKAFAYSLCEDPRSGNVYVCGKVSGHKTPADVDGLVFAVTPAGGVLWQVYQNLGEASTDEYHDIKFTSGGNLLVCGFSNLAPAGAGPFYDTWLSLFNPAAMPGAGGLVWSFKHRFADPLLQTKGYRVIEGKTGPEGGKRYYVVGPVYPATTGSANQMMLEVFNNGVGGGTYHVYPPPYGPLGFDSRFGLDSVEMKSSSPGLAIFSSTVQPPNGTQSNSYLLRTYYNGATCKDLCNAYADNPIQLPAHNAMESCKDTVRRVKKLVYIRYPYADALICSQKAITCGKNTRPIAGIADVGPGTILHEMMLAPNPATNSLNISIANAKVGAYHLEISDMQGRIVLSSVIQLNGAGTRVDVAGLKQGYYVVKMRDGANQWSTPFMKQ